MLVGFLLGILLGLRHALEPDHLAAVSTLFADSRGGGRGALLGAAWGAGHTLSLFGVALVLTLLNASMPARLGDALELGVAVMLVGLGLRSLLRARQHQAHGHDHRADHVHLGAWTLGRRPLLVGLVHGLAGSGALTALALASMPTPASRLAYALLFGIGSIVGMALLTGLAGLPLSRLVRAGQLDRSLVAGTGVLSLGLGLWWGWPLIGRVLAP